MSVELPEAYILSQQMNIELVGKEAVSCTLKDCLKLQNLGFISMYSSDFNKLFDGKIQTIASRGNTILVKFDNDMNLLLAPEYGGKILYHTKGSSAPLKFHLKVCFKDDSALTVTLTGMGIIQALEDQELKTSYVYRRDFSATATPLDNKVFTLERFSKELSDTRANLKSALVGKDAVIVGLGNSSFQDIIYRAGIHPKRKATDLSGGEKQELYNSIKWVIQQRIKSGGKYQFTDLYGKRGCYIPAMGPNMKGKNCIVCGGKVEKLSLGGGQLFCCLNCQH